MKAIACVASALLCIPLAASADVKETEEMAFEVNPGARISVENINGDISVTGGDFTRAEVVAYKKAGTQEYLDELEIVVDADEDYVRIETRHPKQSGGWFNWGNDGSGSVTYELNVPANVSLDAIETVNGDVTIKAVTGTVKALLAGSRPMTSTSGVIS